MKINERYEIIIDASRLTFKDYEAFDTDGQIEMLDAVKRVLELASAWLYDTIKERYVSRPVAREIIFSQEVDNIPLIIKEVMNSVYLEIELRKVMKDEQL
mgnify:CR=1 FL=1